MLIKYILKIAVIIAVSISSLFAQTADEKVIVQEIIDKAETSYKGESSYGSFTMNIVRPDYSRSVKMDSWNEGNDKALIIITAPKKEAGNKTLKIKNEMWTYLKATETTMKLPASMLLQSWNGSDLTNDDLVRESKLSRDYSIKLMFEEKIGKEICWKIRLTPKPDVPVVWGKLYYWVRKADYLPALVQYYDEKGRLHRTMKFQDIKKMGGRIIPTKWKIINNKKENTYTEFIYDKIVFNKKISSRKFSLRELER